MALVLTSGPAIEPVSVDEAKAHLRIDGAHDNALLASLILTSRLHVEAALGLALIEQAWMLALDRWPQAGSIDVPIAPLQAVTAVRSKTASGPVTIVPPEQYLVDLLSKPPRIVWNGHAPPAGTRPIHAVEIDLLAGFGATAESVPAPLRHAILMLTAHWYEHRDPVEIGSQAARIPDAVSDLIQPFRKFRL